jgi:hypothetical protein
MRGWADTCGNDVFSSGQSSDQYLGRLTSHDPPSLNSWWAQPRSKFASDQVRCMRSPLCNTYPSKTFRILNPMI